MGTIAQTVVELRKDRVLELGELVRAAVADDDRLATRLREDERLADMLVRAAETARYTSARAKRAAMGRVVAAAITDRAQVDRSQLLLAALIDLDAPHFALLAKLAEGKRAGDEGQPVAVPTPEPLKAALIRHGLVTTTITWGGGLAVTGISEFGDELLQYVRNEA